MYEWLYEKLLYSLRRGQLLKIITLLDLWEVDNLSIVDKMASLAVSFIQRFHTLTTYIYIILVTHIVIFPETNG